MRYRRINQINKVQWVDFKLENVLVSLHSLKTMGLGSIIFKEWRVTWTFSYTSYISETFFGKDQWFIPKFCHDYIQYKIRKTPIEWSE
jgi:uncharacterized protein (DUF697 family)